jgi:integrase
MQRRKTLSDKGVADLKPRQTRYPKPDPELRGHYIRVMPSGAKSFYAAARNPLRKQVWIKIGNADAMTIEEAREKAREAIARIRSGQCVTQLKTFQEVAEQYQKRHVAAKGVRTAAEIDRCLKKYILPHWGASDFASIRKSDIAALLDQVEDNHGPRMADVCLTIIRAIANWYATRHDDYAPPVMRGMRRSHTKRARILDDDELRAIWTTADGDFGNICKIALLTAQRREKIIAMRWQDITLDGEWTIPTSAREKGSGGTLVLPKAAMQIITARPRLTSNPYVFPGRGAGHFNGTSPGKRALDRKLQEMPRWTLHDLRRTARSLMSRAGVRPDIAERVMGHAIRGVEAVYDRHSYRDEKGHALRQLASLIETIVNPPADNVVHVVALHG